MAGEKRENAEIDERLELCSKKSRMGYLDSGFHSNDSIREVAAESVVDAVPVGLDLNANVAAGRNVVGNETQTCVKETNNVAAFWRKDIECEVSSKSKVFGLDLNAEDVVSSSINNDRPHPHKNLDLLKSKDDSECASSAGPIEERDPLQVWKEMKKNGFLSSSHACVSIPKKRGRKPKTDGIKKNVKVAKKEQVDKFAKIAKKEQVDRFAKIGKKEQIDKFSRKEKVDRFAKIAAPSGLLNGLNLGIMNHVRNSKQVHSIIDALVKSEQNEKSHAVSKPGSLTRCLTKGFSEQKYEKVMYNPGEYKSNQVTQLLDPHPTCQIKGYPGSTYRSVYKTSNLGSMDGTSCMTEPQILGVATDASHFNSKFDDGVFELKLSSSARVQSENMDHLSNEDSGNITSVNSLSVKAASVASQWLELLHQDVKGRLAALRRSKKRVCEVIQTELPCLLSREFPSNQENDLSTSKSSVSHSNNATAEMHRNRWGSLFHQMDNSLSEEEKQLENWLSQVKQMQLHCDMGLFNHNAANGLKQINRVDVDCRSKKVDKLEGDLSVRAAAASIYSTCNFLSSAENQPCC